MLTIEQALDRQGQYRPNDEVRRAISGTALMAFVGGMATGKNYLMHASGLSITGTETTRKPRPDDDPARYTYTDLDTILSSIEAGDVVQYGVSLPSNVYASRVRDYTLDQPNVSDIWYDAVGALDNKGFLSVKSISILTPKDQWLSQLALRLDHMAVSQAADRLAEARRSLRWSVAQHLGGVASHLVIINRTDNVDGAVDRINRFASGETIERTDTQSVLQVADEMTETIDVMYARIGMKS